MLNPLAHEFSPTSFEPKFPPHSSNNKKDARKPPKKETTAVENEKKGTKDKGKQPVRKNQPKETGKPQPKETAKHQLKESAKHQLKESAKNQGKKSKEENGPVKNKGKETARKKRDTRKQSIPAAPSIPPNEFEQESPFIAIEAAIDPVHRLDIKDGDSRRQSLTHDVKKHYEHGYERYIDWVNERYVGGMNCIYSCLFIIKIDRSLHIYGIVTVVGMDKAIADVISMVTILHERKIGQHQGKFTKVI
jgi:hypothetical protein